MEEVANLLFELSSFERLRILLLLGEKGLKLSDLANRIDITTSETSRHLSRLVRTGLVRKSVKGRYELAGLGRMALYLVPYFEFLIGKRSFIQRHDFTVLPPEFIARLGELERSTVFEGFYEVVDIQQSSVEQSNQRIWIMSSEAKWSMGPLLEEKVSKGVDVRIILPKNLTADIFKNGKTTSINIGFLDQVPLQISVLDDRGGICLPDEQGKIDLSEMLAGTDAATYKWLEDLFQYFWKQLEITTS